jgi:hypothetical protein
MTFAGRPVRRWLLPAVALLALASAPTPAGRGEPAAPPQPAAAAATGAAEGDVLAGPPSGVRLRKLHLVRPDLIPYPIAFEVYC